MNTFWREVVKQAIKTGIPWARLIKAFPELDDEVVCTYFTTLDNAHRISVTKVMETENV